VGTTEPGDASAFERDASAFELGTDGPRVIVVGVDDSTSSSRAGWYAAGLARRQHAKIVAVFVSPLTSLGAAGPGGASLAVARDEAFRATAEDMRGRAQLMADELGISITFVATRGDPFAEICRIAEEVRADAIVVGASLHPGHRFAGSLAVRLVRKARWPVTVVP
jgi:nucleotide-binding universal stress UspA family protein